MRQHIQGIHHVAVSVPDIDIARKFYIDLLGAEEVSEVSWEPGNAMIDAIVGLENCSGRQFLARLGNTFIEVFEYLSPRAEPQNPNEGVNRFGYTHFCLQVDDIMTVYDRMLKAGIRFHTPPHPDSITISTDGTKQGYAATYGRDFFGNVFELIEVHANEQIPPF